uniref:CAB/ELIP/HLIP superfamily protein n=1 Tax=Riquetophycus sp. TaxID=1897556 RepID=A0A1C9C8A7_9FLOR|nr:CAB/ELIP/HLIP superfamily protein [Riquetophycus sp.]
MYHNQWICGCSQSAEKWNGRLAMLAFSVIFIFEISTSISILYVLAISSY